MTPDDLTRLEQAVDAQRGRTLGACIPVMPGQLDELLRVYRSHNGKRQEIGRFHTPEEASAAYLAAKAQLHTFMPVPR